MSHGHAAGPGAEDCQISMLWNWNTVGACFLSETWFVRTEGMMVVSCVGAMLLTATLELCRRGGREFDNLLASQIRQSVLSTAVDTSSRRVVTMRASLLQQFLRSLLHAITFAVAYIVMLLAMYFNGYILISIFLGAGLGKFLTDWLVVQVVMGEDGKTDCRGATGVQETTVCCS
ncbi:hypothetical protein PspLS_01704 [Pyricularia sp. CBS 133598]|nr:hypothetical protein PspLS_01704 [Pyricularia sp. CBS 133598]